ncbi:MAG TPA: NUDIX domain-containing protein [Candidatus Dormibacteraeota bacterium]|nr:NUDIX domain-containing protein [Candidatus Dormibacteraeota bacterium]
MSTFASPRRPERLVRLSQLRRLRDCEQVAAVCYRVAKDGIEFLLIRTRGNGRWTFPKGSTEAGLTHAQAAALEAFEEAGVHGRIEEASFARYVRRKRSDGRKSRGVLEKETEVNAHLCEVSRLSPPQESNRDRTWFSAQDARRRLREGREAQDGASFARVVDRAVARIERLRSKTEVVDFRQGDDGPGGFAARRDALQQVRFEAFEGAYREIAEAWFGTDGRPKGIVAVKSRQTLQGEVLEFLPGREKKTKALGTGTRNR